MQTILHLTDIHFGWEGNNSSDQAARKLCLDGILAELKQLDPSWKPTIICITGDIAWRSSESDYIDAQEWLDKLLEACSLTYDDMIVCPGNHDVIRSYAEKLSRPGSSGEADKVLEPPLAEHYEKPFCEYTSFCQLIGIPILKFGEVDSYLVGTRTINDIRFVVLNSAWFSKDNSDDRQLWIGLPHLKYMEAQGVFNF